MDLNLFWYAQEALTSSDVYLAPDTPFRGTQRAYELTQQRNQRITERAIRCHAYELQQSHNSIAQHFDKESLHAPTEKEPLLEFTCGDKFLRDNLHKIDKLLEDTETMMSSEYEPMDMSDDESPVLDCASNDDIYREKFRKEAEDAYGQYIQWHIDSQQTRWEELRRYMTDEAASIMNEIVQYRKSLPQPASTTHNTSDQHNPKHKRKRNKRKKTDQPEDNQQQQQSTPSTPSSSIKKSQTTQQRPSSSASSSHIPPPVISSSSSSSTTSRVPEVIPASTSLSIGRSNQVPNVVSSSSLSSTPRVPEVASASSWNPSSYRPSLVDNGKLAIKRVPGKGFQVVCEKKNEPTKILGTPQEFDDAMYRPQPKASIKVQSLHGIRVFRSIDDRGRLQTIAQVDEIEPLIRQYFLTSSRGHDRML